jgi:hypothetical protein
MTKRHESLTQTAEVIANEAPKHLILACVGVHDRRKSGAVEASSARQNHAFRGLEDSTPAVVPDYSSAGGRYAKTNRGSARRGHAVGQIVQDRANGNDPLQLIVAGDNRQVAIAA